MWFDCILTDELTGVSINEIFLFLSILSIWIKAPWVTKLCSQINVLLSGDSVLAINKVLLSITNFNVAPIKLLRAQCSQFWNLTTAS